MTRARTRTRPRPTSTDCAKDHGPDPVTTYAQAVVAGEIVAGPHVRRACARHLRDLAEGPARGLTWSLDRAQHVFGYYRHVLRLNGGQFEGAPFELRLWQAFVVGSVFGWLGPDGYRRFRTAYIEIGKGNGKSPLAAGIGLYCLTADKEARAEVYAAAATRDQAMVLFRDAVAMRNQSPHLAKQLIAYGGLNPWNLFFPRADSFFRTISNDDKQSGPRPHCGLCDEVHEHPDGAVVDMLKAGFKFRRQPLLIEITNSGHDRNSVCYEHHDYTLRVLDGRVVDDAWFGYVCALDEGDDWRDETVWRKANPNLGVSITEKYLREQVKTAEGMPSVAAKVQRLNFCIWVDADNPWIDGDLWRACEADLQIEDFVGAECFGGVDLSGRSDLTAFTVVFPRDGKFHAFTWFYAPSEGIRDREDRDRVPYAVWRDQKHLQVTPGRSIDYAFAAQTIADIRQKFALRAVAFDRYRIDDLIAKIDELGLSTGRADLKCEDLPIADVVLCKHGQGFQDMGPAVETLESSVLNATLRVARNPIMTMCAANAVTSSDPTGARKFDKRPGKSTGRIDGIVSLAMALRLATLHVGEGVSVYDTRGIVTL